MNYHARLVLYLRDQGVIDKAEADAVLSPAGEGGYIKSERPMLLAEIRRLCLLQVGLVTTMSILLAFLHVSRIGAPAPAVLVADEAGASTESGFLNVLVDPWADVYVDGQFVDTTPFSRPLRLSEGDHLIELKNPYFQSVARPIKMTSGTRETLRQTLQQTLPKTQQPGKK